VLPLALFELSSQRYENDTSFGFALHRAWIGFKFNDAYGLGESRRWQNEK